MVPSSIYLGIKVFYFKSLPKLYTFYFSKVQSVFLVYNYKLVELTNEAIHIHHFNFFG
ncbi:uncharacterized protein METZ01_LOCUS101672 [marine metagenome]|uniref:Uncharacterized protein n=1 Tax=marine metagenome TaxID=408172 RepID=A0A381W9X9_9ZZZZ